MRTKTEAKLSRIAVRAAMVAAAAMLVSGCVSVAEQVATLRQYDAISASPGTTPDHDYAVVIRNLRPLGVEMANKTDRQKLAVAFLGERCPAGRTVSETELATRTPGLTANSKDYAIRIKC